VVLSVVAFQLGADSRTLLIEELIERITRAIQEEVPEADQIFIELRPPKQPGPE
jgi:dihydroneopterin aldolase